MAYSKEDPSGVFELVSVETDKDVVCLTFKAHRQTVSTTIRMGYNKAIDIGRFLIVRF
jgi:hypothetical protein